MFVNIEDTRGCRKKGYLGQGDSSFNEDEIYQYEVQHEQQDQENIHEYEICVV